MENNDTTIQSLDWLSASAECFSDIQFHQHVQVVATTREFVMLLLIQNNNNVTGFQTNFLIALAIENL